MKKFMTSFAAISMATMMAVSMVGCSTANTPQGNTEVQQTIANPVKEMSEEEMTQLTGIDLPLPADAKDVVYSVIDTEDGNIAQVQFTLNGDKMYLRARSTQITNLTNIDESTDFTKPEDFQNIENHETDISGLNYNWNTFSQNYVQDREAVIQTSKQGAGYIAWIDVAPGILYNLCMEKNADADKLLATANDIFVPLQGEAEAETVDYADLMNEIYNTKAGTAGSAARVEEAARKLTIYAINNSADITAQNQEALATETLNNMKATYGEDFVANFKECFDAVVEEAMNENSDLETDVTFNQVVNGVLNSIEAMN